MTVPLGKSPARRCSQNSHDHLSKSVKNKNSEFRSQKPESRRIQKSESRRIQKSESRRIQKSESRRIQKSESISKKLRPANNCRSPVFNLVGTYAPALYVGCLWRTLPLLIVCQTP